MDYLHIIYNDYNVQRLLEDVGGKVSCGSCVCVARAAVATHCGSHDLGCKPRPWKASKWQRRKKNVYTVAAEATMVSWGATEATTATVDQGGPVSPQTVHTSQLIATHCNWHHIVASHSVVHPLKLPCHVEKGVEEWKMVEDGGRWWKMVEDGGRKRRKAMWMDMDGCEWMWMDVNYAICFHFFSNNPWVETALGSKADWQIPVAFGIRRIPAFGIWLWWIIKHQTSNWWSRNPFAGFETSKNGTLQPLRAAESCYHVHVYHCLSLFYVILCYGWL